MKIHLPLPLRAALVACFATLSFTSTARADDFRWGTGGEADSCYLGSEGSATLTISTEGHNPSANGLFLRGEADAAREATIGTLTLTHATSFNIQFTWDNPAANHFSDLRIGTFETTAQDATLDIREHNTVTIGSFTGDGADSLAVTVTGTLKLDINTFEDIYTQIQAQNGTMHLDGQYDATAYTSAQTVDLGNFTCGSFNVDNVTVRTGKGLSGTLSYTADKLQLIINEASVHRVVMGTVQPVTTTLTAPTGTGTQFPAFSAPGVDGTKSWTMTLTGTALKIVNPDFDNVILSTSNPGATAPHPSYGSSDFALLLGFYGDITLVGAGRSITIYEGLGDTINMGAVDLNLTLKYEDGRLFHEAGTIRIDGMDAVGFDGATSTEYLTLTPTKGMLDELYMRLAGGSKVDLSVVDTSIPYGWEIEGNATVQDLNAAVYGDKGQDNKVAMTAGDTLIFKGGKLTTTENYVLANPITAEQGNAVALAATTGKTLTVLNGEAALNTANTQGLEVSGGGTVSLQGLTTAAPVNMTVSADTTLDLNGTPETLTIDSAQNNIDSTASLSRSDGGALSFTGSQELHALSAAGIEVQDGASLTARRFNAATATVGSGADLTIEYGMPGLTTLTNEGSIYVAGGVSVSGTYSGSGDLIAVRGENHLAIMSGSTVEGLNISSPGISATGVAGGSLDYILSTAQSETDPATPQAARTETFRLGKVEGLAFTATGGHVTIMDTQFDAASSVKASEEGLTLTRVSFAGSSAVEVGAGGFSTGDAAQGLNSVTLTGEAAETGLTLNHIGVNLRGAGITDPTDVVILTGTDITLAEGYTQSYTLDSATFATLGMNEQGELVLNVYRDEETVNRQLADTPERGTALGSLLANGADGVLKELREFVQDNSAYSLAERHAALDALSGSSLTMLADSQRRGIMDTLGSLRNRIVQMGTPADTEHHSTFNAWVEAEGAYHDISKDGSAAGYTYSTWGGSVGGYTDYGNTSFGMSLGVRYGELSADYADQAEGDHDSYSISAFMRHQSGSWMHVGILSFGLNDLSLTRRVQGYESYAAEGDSKGHSLSAYYEGGYTFSLTEDGTQVLQPIASLMLTTAHMGAYSESGSIGNAALHTEAENYVYGQVGLGARYQAVLGYDENERIAFAELRAKLVQDFGDETDEASVCFKGGRTPYTVRGAEVGRFGVQVGAGISLPVGISTTLFADVDADFRSRATSVSGGVGVRYEF